MSRTLLSFQIHQRYLSQAGSSSKLWRIFQNLLSLCNIEEGYLWQRKSLNLMWKMNTPQTWIERMEGRKQGDSICSTPKWGKLTVMHCTVSLAIKEIRKMSLGAHIRAEELCGWLWTVLWQRGERKCQQMLGEIWIVVRNISNQVSNGRVNRSWIILVLLFGRLNFWQS